MMTKNQQENRAKDQAKLQLESIREMVKALQTAQEENDDKVDEARERILQDPLSVEVRTGWHTPGSEDATPTEYAILLCTGGPAVRIVGDLSEYQEPESAHLEFQDWFTPWTPYLLDAEEEADVLEYARQFYFGA